MVLAVHHGVGVQGRGETRPAALLRPPSPSEAIIQSAVRAATSAASAGGVHGIAAEPDPVDVDRSSWALS